MKFIFALMLVVLSWCAIACTSQPPPPDPCEWMHTEKPAATAAHTVVLLDRSNSMRGDKAFDPVEVLDKILDNVMTQHDVVSIGSFDGGATTARWAGERLVTDGGRNNPRLQKADDKVARQCLTDLLRQSADQPPEQAKTDVLGAFAVAKDELAQSGGARHAVIVTDGLATVGCADVTNHVGDQAAVQQARQLCMSRPGELPDMHGIQVDMVGVGHPGGTAQPGSSHLAWFSQYWLDLCGAAGADTCAVSVSPVKVADKGRPVVKGVDDPEVTFPPDAGGMSPRPVIQVSDKVLFKPNRSEISDQGRQALAALAGRSIPAGTTVEVHGYTEAKASPKVNEELAQQRADAVAGVLREHDVSATGIGHDGRAPGCAVGEDEQARQCTRRVDISLKGAG